MKRQPVIIRAQPDTAELQRRQARRCQMAALLRKASALATEGGIGGRDFGAAMIETGALAIKAATDGPSAASVLRAVSARIAPELPQDRPHEAAERVFGGRR